MYNNVGKTIKVVAVIFCWLGIIGCTIFSLISILNLYTGSFVPQEMRIALMKKYIVNLVLGILASWLGSLVLYGFGELIYKVDSIDSKLSEKDK